MNAACAISSGERERPELPGRSRSPLLTNSIPRFTLDGDLALEEHLQLTCDRVVSGIRGIIPPHILQAIVLGGGYGRGEGGVLRPSPSPLTPYPLPLTPSGDRPYNDLEFYVVARGSRHLYELLYRRPLEVLGHILTHLADVEVEFKIASLNELTVQPPSMFSYDLLAGHRLVWCSDPNRQGLAPPVSAESLPIAEATRLLMNRCTGLLLAEDLLRRQNFPDTAADFVRRNIAKAQLACGDAILTARGLYHWSCQERAQRLNQIVELENFPWLEELQRHHSAGVAFKLHPKNSPEPLSDLRNAQSDVVRLAERCWLWIESRRLGTEFRDIHAYVTDPSDKWPGGSPLRNFAVHRRLRHPRDTVLRTLALLLWAPANNSGPEDFTAAVARYRSLWERAR